MNTELQSINIPDSSIKFTVSEIKYDFTHLKEKALHIQEDLKTVVVTEDTVKSNKKLVAELNKISARLEDERKLVKNKLLEPYTKLEIDVKEIVNIIKETDNSIRSQIRELEEIERESKKESILEIYNKRAELYNLSDFTDFEDIITTSHLNKTTTMKSIEQDIVDYFERVKNDINTINVLDNKSIVLEYYLDTKDLTTSIQLAKQREEREKQVQAISKSNDDIKVNDELNNSLRSEGRGFKYVIGINDDKDFKLFELLMKDGGVEYEVF